MLLDDARYLDSARRASVPLIDRLTADGTLASTWRPVAVAWGVISLWILIAVELTSLLMKYLPRRVWHAVHLSSFGLFFAATAHAISAGTDHVNGPEGLWPEVDDEIVFLVKAAGLTPMQALSAATLTGARGAGQERERGSLVAGQLADFVALIKNRLGCRIR